LAKVRLLRALFKGSEALFFALIGFYLDPEPVFRIAFWHFGFAEKPKAKQIFTKKIFKFFAP